MFPMSRIYSSCWDSNHTKTETCTLAGGLFWLRKVGLTTASKNVRCLEHYKRSIGKFYHRPGDGCVKALDRFARTEDGPTAL